MSKGMGVLNARWLRWAQSWRQSLAANTKLGWMLGLIGLVILAELGLRWFDDVQAQFAQRAELQSTLSQIKTQIKDPKNLEITLASAREAKSLAENRLLEVNFEALAQAQLHDWIGQITKEANAQVLRLTVGSARPIPTAASSNAARISGAVASPPSAPTASSMVTQQSMVEVPITLVLRFSPQTLSNVLGQIEGGDWLVRVETLSIRRNDRRVEIGFVVPVRLQGGAK